MNRRNFLSQTAKTGALTVAFSSLNQVLKAAEEENPYEPISWYYTPSGSNKSGEDRYETTIGIYWKMFGSNEDIKDSEKKILSVPAEERVVKLISYHHKWNAAEEKHNVLRSEYHYQIKDAAITRYMPEGKAYHVVEYAMNIEQQELLSGEAVDTDIFPKTMFLIYVNSEVFLYDRKGGQQLHYMTIAQVSPLGCFLTTACTQYKGLPDDCAALTTLRTFRDQYMAYHPDGPALIQEYYQMAPKLLERIREQEEASILEHIYEHLVLPSVDLIQDGELEEAMFYYHDYTLQLKRLLA
jgi:hypothetical protein